MCVINNIIYIYIVSKRISLGVWVDKKLIEMELLILSE